MNQNNINLATLDLNLITALSALLQHRSVSSAAEAVGRTQSAMSHSLARLREHFRDPILVRDGWGMRLTPFARDLHPRVSAAAEAAKLVFTPSFEFHPAKTTRQIRIATPDLCASLFTDLISEISKCAPLASVKFTESSVARDAVLKSEADIGLGFGHQKSDPNLVLIPLVPLDWCTFTPDSHEYSKNFSQEAWSGSRHILVDRGGAREGPVENMLQKQGITRNVVSYTSTFSAALILASETGALFTTLRAPFQKSAYRLGMTALPLPFNMPDAPATIILRTEYGNPFSVWLNEICKKALL